MSEQTTSVSVPQWDLADRMRKALREADIGVNEMAEYLGVARNTVSTWINGRITPNRQTQRLWALRCGVSYEWLRTGQEIVSAQSCSSLRLVTWRDQRGHRERRDRQHEHLPHLPRPVIARPHAHLRLIGVPA